MPTHKKILLIDDDSELTTIIKRYMDRDGYFTDISNTASNGIIKAEANDYQLVVLDVMLPEMDGFAVLSEIRKISNVPVLMLTAKDSESDKIHYLKHGADDYMTKPFSPEELMARVESLIRRYTDFGQMGKMAETIEHNGMTLNPQIREAIINDKPVDLTGKEFDLLYFLASHKNIVFTKRQIYREVWNEEYAFDDSNIMSFISKLRKKIEEDSDNPKYIQTIRGVGYRFNQGT